MKKQLLICSFLCCGNALADVQCSEKLTELHTGNEKVYFKSDQTCKDNFCILAFQNEKANERAYSILLAGYVSSQSIAFQWRDIDSCDSSNKAEAAPAFVGMKN
ncbi:hypothetical protein [Planctobacterium marinum]|uniref:Uncharacterized protein n=1 Tax=Planctobacterium marinum TaxID=1631968 RepID=A0AA48KNS8_9ALTE|nr:hypothetical protein MACH26_13870 [Planctobacterium marinum]